MNTGPTEVDPSTQAQEKIQKILLASTQQGVTVRFRVRGGSMWPTIRSGSVVIVERTDLSQCRVGDIVLWSDRDRWILHRLIRAGGRDTRPMFQTQGDSVGRADRLVDADCLIGRLTEIEVNGRSYRLDRGLHGIANGIITALALRSPGLLRCLTQGLRLANATFRVLVALPGVPLYWNAELRPPMTGDTSLTPESS